MFIRVEGSHCAKLLKDVNLPTDNTQYKKLGEGFLDEEVVNDRVYDWVKPYLNSYSSFYFDAFAKWYNSNEETAWFDLREDEEGTFYAAAGDNEGIKFLDRIEFFTIDYNGFEINVEGYGKDNYFFSFWIDPDGGILRASDEECGFFFYDDLEKDEADYPRKDYTLKSAIDDLISNSDKYQNACEEEDDEE